MYNLQLYNVGMYNGNHAITIDPLSNDPVSFNGYSLLNGTTVVASSVYYEELERDPLFSQKPRGHGQIFNNSFWRKKRIRIDGWLTTDTQTELEDLIFEFKKQVSAPEGYLDIILADGSRRRFICTLVNQDPVQRGEHFHISTCPFSLEFECSVPFGQAIDPTSIGDTVTDLIYNGSIVNEGNVECDVDIVLIFNSASSVTKVNFANTTTGEEIELESAISAGDIIKFDGQNKQVLLNGSTQDFVGSFITAKVGANDYTLTVTGSSVEYELTINTPINYL